MTDDIINPFSGNFNFGMSYALSFFRFYFNLYTLN